MLYLLDANSLIDAHGNYYGIERVPEFWDWLIHQATNGIIQMPRETYDEVLDGRPDLLTEWLGDDGVKSVLLLQEDADPALVALVSDAYAPDLTDEEVQEIGNDPFLISYAVGRDRCVVSSETSAPSKKRANKKVPDICDGFGVKHCNTVTLIRDLDFKTNWR